MKNKRVGTISMAIVLIALGVLIFMSQINKVSTLDIALKLWPAILILLGLEILYYRFIYKEETIIKYDILSIFIVFAILITNLGLFAITEIGVLSKIKTMALMDYYRIDMEVDEIEIDSSIKKIIIDGISDNITIRSTEKNSITGSGMLGINATSREEAIRYKEETSINFKRNGDTIYISSLENNTFGGLGYFRLYDLNLNIPKGIDVEVKSCNNVELVYDGSKNNFVLDGNSSVYVRLNAESDIKINAYVESKDFLDGNVDWKFNEFGEYVKGEGNNIIKILKSHNITADEI